MCVAFGSAVVARGRLFRLLGCRLVSERCMSVVVGGSALSEVDICGSCDQELAVVWWEGGVAVVLGTVLYCIQRGYVVCMYNVASTRWTVCRVRSWCWRMFHGMVLGCGAVRMRCAAVIRVVCW